MLFGYLCESIFWEKYGEKTSRGGAEGEERGRRAAYQNSVYA